MQKVLEGKMILIDWINKIETSMSITFTLENGERLLEYYKLPIVNSKVDLGWSFTMFNPHVERYSSTLRIDEILLKVSFIFY